jgi:hypothetical protein
MADPRIDEIVAGWDSVIARREAAIAEKTENDRREREFNEAWRRAYTNVSLGMTNEVAQAIAQRLLHLAGLMHEQFWDFHLAELLRGSAGNQHDVLVVRLLAHACAGHGSELPGYLVQARKLFPSAEVHHGDLIERFRVLSAKGLPYTPPISQSDLLRTIGVKLAAFRWARSRGKWELAKGDDQHHKRLRRWRHIDPASQRKFLSLIREKKPEILWSALR